MNRILFTSTALGLVLSAGAASAQITITLGGDQYFEFGYVDKKARHSSLATSAVDGVGIGAGLCGRARWSCRERISPSLRERILVPGGWHGCPSGCWHPDGALSVDLRDHRRAPGALCRHGPGTADRHHADRLGRDQPSDPGGAVPAALDQLLLDGAQGQVRRDRPGPGLMSHREAGVPVRALRCGR